MALAIRCPPVSRTIERRRRRGFGRADKVPRGPVVIWTILPHLTACACGEAVILLDLRADRYFRAPARLAPQIRDWFTEGGGAAPSRIADFLVRSGLVEPDDLMVVSATAATVSIPTAVPDQVVVPALPRLGTARLASVVLGTWLALRTRRLEAVIHAHQSQRPARSPAGPILSPAMLGAYHRARRLVPIGKNCLLDSLALDRWLGDTTPPRSIVLGVTAEPFLAHCWLQTSAMLLNDHPDHVRRYAPILVV